MKKMLFTIVLFLLFLIVITLFVLPYGLGFVAQHKYTQIIGMLSKSNTVQVSLVRYQRGWFSSDATIKISMQMPIGLVQQTTKPFLITQHIAHGPVFSLLSGTGEKRLAVGQTLITTHAHSPFGALHMVSKVKLNGKLVGTFNAPTLQLHYTDVLHGENTAELQGVSGKFTLSPDLQQWIAAVDIPEISIKTDTFTQQLHNTHFFYNLNKSQSGLFLGKHICTIDTMTWSADFIPGKDLKVEKIRLVEQDAEKDRKIQAKIDAELKYVTLKNATYGPQQLQITIRDLDVPALLAWTQALHPFSDTPLSSLQKYQKYRQLLLNLLSRGVQLKIEKLALVTPWGTPSLVAQARIAPRPMSTFIDLMAGTQSRVAVHLPASFLMRVLERVVLPYMQAPVSAVTKTTPPSAMEMAQRQITEWIHNKWLLPEGDGYTMVILYQNQHMTINNQPLIQIGTAPQQPSGTTPPIGGQQLFTPVTPVHVESDA
jgi:hypothetical protein